MAFFNYREACKAVLTYPVLYFRILLVARFVYIYMEEASWWRYKVSELLKTGFGWGPYRSAKSLLLVPNSYYLVDQVDTPTSQMKFFSSFASSMGLLLSFLLSASIGVVKHKFFSAIDNVETIMMRSVGLFLKLGEMYLRRINFKKDSETDQKAITGSNKMTIEELVSFPFRVSEKLKIETSVSFKKLDKRNIDRTTFKEKDDNSIFQLKSLNGIMPSQSVDSELDAAAMKLQKVYKSYRTRRNLADSAVVAEELWWKALEFAALKQSSVLFFDTDKRETAVSRWKRARIRVAKVGKVLSKDENARKLALQHWLEAIDPRHRYGHNLHYYYNVWLDSESSQPFFYWLDVGDGKEVNLERCPRNTLQHQCIKYLGPKEREAYEVVVDNGKLVYKQSGRLVDTSEGSKWIFVLSTSRSLYVGQKKKGLFQHSSFLAGGATTAAGRLVSRNGILQAIWPYSGHYLPTEENFREFINFLEEHHVDLTNVKTCSLDTDSSSFRIRDERDLGDIVASKGDDRIGEYMINVPAEEAASTVFGQKNEAIEFDKANVQEEEEEPAKPTGFEWRENRLPCKWSTGAGPRIG